MPLPTHKRIARVHPNPRRNTRFRVELMTETPRTFRTELETWALLYFYSASVAQAVAAAYEKGGLAAALLLASQECAEDV